MTSDEMEKMYTLCKQITVEKNQTKFTELVQQLNELLEQKNKRLNGPTDTKI
jgi:hypothetical protein